MKTLLKAFAVIILGAIGAAGVIFADSHCPKKEAKQQEQINHITAQYVENNTQKIVENIAKNEDFANAVRNLSGVSEDSIAALVQNALEKNPEIFDNYIQNHISFIASRLAETKEFKNIKSTSDVTDETPSSEESSESNVFLEHWDELKNSDVSPSVGPRDAQVTVVEFFDFACGHCKALAPIMSQLIKDNPDVRFIFNPLYFISEYSPYAAKVSLAAAEKGKFAEVFDGIMTLPDMNEETINQILTDEGLDLDEVKQLIEEKKIRRGIQNIDSLSQVLNIQGVPMIIINGEPFYGRSLEDLQNKINSYK